MEAGWVEGLPYGSAEGSKEGWVLAGTPAASGLSISAAARETACFGLGSGSGFGFGLRLGLGLGLGLGLALGVGEHGVHHLD